MFPRAKFRTPIFEEVMDLKKHLVIKETLPKFTNLSDAVTVHFVDRKRYSYVPKGKFKNNFFLFQLIKISLVKVKQGIIWIEFTSKGPCILAEKLRKETILNLLFIKVPF